MSNSECNFPFVSLTAVVTVAIFELLISVCVYMNKCAITEISVCVHFSIGFTTDLTGHSCTGCIPTRLP